MISIISLLIILIISMIFTRVGQMALMLTGISKEVARFQARSAFTGVGFTTKESEIILEHPVRRNIVMYLMMCGNIGIVTVAGTFMMSVISVNGSSDWRKHVVALVSALFVFWFVSTSKFIERHMNKMIAFALRKWTSLEVQDYMSLLNLSNGYGVSEFKVSAEDRFCNKCLAQSLLSNEGLLILAIKRANGGFVGAPDGDSYLNENDTIVVYGPLAHLNDFDPSARGAKNASVSKIRNTPNADLEFDDEGYPSQVTRL